MIITITGKLGSGKTLALLHQLHMHADIGNQVYTNLNIDTKESRHAEDGLIRRFNKIEELLKLPSWEMTSSVVVGIDEGWMYFDSRNPAMRCIAEDFLSWVSRTKSTVYIAVQTIDMLCRSIRGKVALQLETTYYPSIHFVKMEYEFPAGAYCGLLKLPEVTKLQER